LTGFRGARRISCNCRENIKKHANSLEIILVYSICSNLDSEMVSYNTLYISETVKKPDYSSLDRKLFMS
jgi:hypothetical protein